MKRLRLFALVAAYLFLAVNGSVLTPLWESGRELEHAQLVAHWAERWRPPRWTEQPPGRLELGGHPPLAALAHAAAAVALDLDDVVFAPRTRRADATGDRPLYLHGRDEVFPFRGPARRWHLLRLLDVVFGLAAVLGVRALVARLRPDAPGLADLGAALLATHPPFLAAAGRVDSTALLAALTAWSAVALVDLRRAARPTRGAGVRAGLLVGAALLSGLPALALLPAAVPVALALRRATPTGRLAADGLLAGVIVLVGPWWALNTVRAGDPLGWQVLVARQDVLTAAARGSEAPRAPAADAPALGEPPPVAEPDFLADLGVSAGTRLAHSVLASDVVADLWLIVAVLVALGVLGTLLRRGGAAAGATGRGPLLAALLAALLGIWVAWRAFGRIESATWTPALVLGIALGAAGWPARARPLAVLGTVVIALVSFRAQAVDLGPAFWPVERSADPLLLAHDPLAPVPAVRRLPTIRWIEPAPDSVHREPPLLRWKPPADPVARFTVLLDTPGSPRLLASFEQTGHAAHDRFLVPAEIWEQLPSGSRLLARAVRLPDAETALAAPPGALDVDETLPLSLWKESRPPGAAAAGR